MEAGERGGARAEQGRDGPREGRTEETFAEARCGCEVVTQPISRLCLAAWRAPRASLALESRAAQRHRFHNLEFRVARSGQDLSFGRQLMLYKLQKALRYKLFCVS